MKKIVSVILLIFMFSASITYANNFYVSDNANILSEDTEDFICTHSELLCEKTGAQIAFVSVDNMNGENEREYAISVARKMKLGNDTNNGVLIFFALSERKIDVEIGYGLEGAIPDSKAGRLIDTYAISYLKENDFDSGILNLYKAILKEVYAEYNLEFDENLSPVSSDDENDISSVVCMILFLIAVAVVIIISKILSDKNNRNGKNNGGGQNYRKGYGRGFFGGYYTGQTFGKGNSHGGFGSGSRGGGGSFGGGGSSRGF